jgi:hypothetical protein
MLYQLSEIKTFVTGLDHPEVIAVARDGKLHLAVSTGGSHGLREVHMDDPAELIDSRPSDAPLALWRNRIVLSVHHDTPGARTKTGRHGTVCCFPAKCPS